VDVLTDETDGLDEIEAHGEELEDLNPDFELENELIVEADKEELEDTVSDDDWRTVSEGETEGNVLAIDVREAIGHGEADWLALGDVDTESQELELGD